MPWGRHQTRGLRQFQMDPKQFKDHLIAQVSRRDNIQVKLNTPATPALIEAEQFDAVVAALGGCPPSHPIQGLSAVKKYLVFR